MTQMNTKTVRTPAGNTYRLTLEANITVGSDVTVTTVHQWGEGIWSLVATSEGRDLLVSPNGKTYDALDRPDLPEEVTVIVQYIIDNV